MSVIIAEGVSKSFGATRALSDISIQVERGEIYGFLGLNGAGKSTLIRSILGMIVTDSGVIKLFGEKVSPDFTQWNKVGYMVETARSYPDLTVRQNLLVYYNLRRLTDPNAIESIIERLNLNPYSGIKAKNLSLGNQQRLGLAKALMHKPALLILDEPVNGLDPEGIVEVREMLKELSVQGSTIFLSSHILGEISKITDRFAIIQKGKMITELDAEEFDKQLIRKLLIDTRDNVRASEILSLAGHRTDLDENGELEVLDDRAIGSPEIITQLLVNRGLPPRKVFLFKEDLEMYFLRTVKNTSL